MNQIAYLFTCLFIVIPSLLFTQDTTVINSNFLVERGISPRVLDAAFNSFLQDGSFTQNMQMELIAGEESDDKAAELEMIYDPNYQQGLDIRFVYDPNKGLTIKRKKLKNLAESTHFFSRQTSDYFYNESSLRIVEKSGNKEVISFKYKHDDIPSTIKRIKKMKGLIYIENGKLDKVTITNEKPFRANGKVLKYEQTSYFSKAENTGGYLVSAIDEEVTLKKGRGTKTFYNSTITTSYSDKAGNPVTWQGDKEVPYFKNSITTDTVEVGLGPIFPIFGRAAKKVGYDIPRPFGFDVFTHLQNQKMEMTDLSIWLNEGDTLNFNEFFDYSKSKVSSTTGLAMGRADAWIFPFLNVMVLVGAGTNGIDAPLKIDEEVRQKLDEYGWLVGIDTVPEEIPIKTTINATMYGGGATLAWGYKNFNISVSGMYMVTNLKEANTTNTALILSPLVGYMTPWFNVMAGAQAQFYSTRVKGNFRLDADRILNYNVDFVAQKWNFIAGIYKDMWKHFIFSAQFGFGARQSMTVIIGYRI